MSTDPWWATRGTRRLLKRMRMRHYSVRPGSESLESRACKRDAVSVAPKGPSSLPGSAEPVLGHQPHPAGMSWHRLTFAHGPLARAVANDTASTTSVAAASIAPGADGIESRRNEDAWDVIGFLSYTTLGIPQQIPALGRLQVVVAMRCGRSVFGVRNQEFHQLHNCSCAHDSSCQFGHHTQWARTRSMSVNKQQFLRFSAEGRLAGSQCVQRWMTAKTRRGQLHGNRHRDRTGGATQLG